MESFKLIFLLALVANVVLAAPSPVPEDQSPSTASSLASDSSAGAPNADAATTNSSLIVPKLFNFSYNNTALNNLKEANPILKKNSTFTCFGREMGYYADIERDCRVYIFCMAADYNGELVYQRISYLCLNNDVFDQQALDCVSASKTTTKCSQSSQHFSKSNEILRTALAGSIYENQHSNDSTNLAASNNGTMSAPTEATSSQADAAATGASTTESEPKKQQ